MKKDKTMSAIKLASMEKSLTPPKYIMNAIHDLAHMCWVESGEDCILCKEEKNA